jgi:flagellar motor switch protein FliN
MAKKKTKKSSAPPLTTAKQSAPSATPDIDNVPVTAALELGRSKITLDTALRMTRNSVLELDRKINDPVDVVINGKLIARGEVVGVSGNFGVRITEIIESD